MGTRVLRDNVVIQMFLKRSKDEDLWQKERSLMESYLRIKADCTKEICSRQALIDQLSRRKTGRDITASVASSIDATIMQFRLEVTEHNARWKKELANLGLCMQIALDLVRRMEKSSGGSMVLPDLVLRLNDPRSVNDDFICRLLAQAIDTLNTFDLTENIPDAEKAVLLALVYLYHQSQKTSHS